VYAIDAATGTERWSFPTGDIVDSSPAVANGVVYVGSFDGRIYAIDALTGSMLWNFITRGRVRSSPAVDNGVVYVGSLDNRVYALDAASGAVLWRGMTGKNVRGSPSVVDGAVYVGSDDHALYAYGLGAGGPASGRTRPSPLPAGQPSADFNGDGFQDVAVGTIFENIGSSDLNAGAVNVMYGSAAGLQATGTGGPDDQFWYQGENGMLGQPHTGNHFGFCAQPGDFNADGYDDLAIGIELQQIGDQP